VVGKVRGEERAYPAERERENADKKSQKRRRREKSERKNREGVEARVYRRDADRQGEVINRDGGREERRVMRQRRHASLSIPLLQPRAKSC
jgi:hypothetical protein